MTSRNTTAGELTAFIALEELEREFLPAAAPDARDITEVRDELRALIRGLRSENADLRAWRTHLLSLRGAP